MGELQLLVVTVLVVVQIRYFAVALHLHIGPWRWLRRQLLFLPLLCLLFVPLTYGLRHAVYAALGEVYTHAGWVQIYTYESVSLSLFYLLWLGVVFGLATREHLLTERIHARRPHSRCVTPSSCCYASSCSRTSCSTHSI